MTIWRLKKIFQVKNGSMNRLWWKLPLPLLFSQKVPIVTFPSPKVLFHCSILWCFRGSVGKFWIWFLIYALLSSEQSYFHLFAFTVASSSECTVYSLNLLWLSKRPNCCSSVTLICVWLLFKLNANYFYFKCLSASFPSWPLVPCSLPPSLLFSGFLSFFEILSIYVYVLIRFFLWE